MAKDASFHFGPSGDTSEPVEFTFEYYLDHRARIDAEVSRGSRVLLLLHR